MEFVSRSESRAGVFDEEGIALRLSGFDIMIQVWKDLLRQFSIDFVSPRQL